MSTSTLTQLLNYDAMLLPQSYLYPNLSEGADRAGGQLREDKECPFSGVTSSSRVWRQVPESDARSVEGPFSGVTISGRVWRQVPESDVRSVVRSLRWPKTFPRPLILPSDTESTRL